MLYFCSTLSCNSVYFITLSFLVLHSPALLLSCPDLHCSALSFPLLDCPSTPCTVLNFVNCPALSWIVMCFTSVQHCLATVYFITLSCLVLHSPALSFTVMHCPFNALYCPKFFCLDLHWLAMSCTVLHRSPLSFTKLHCPAMLFTVLHYLICP